MPGLSKFASVATLVRKADVGVAPDQCRAYAAISLCAQMLTYSTFASVFLCFTKTIGSAQGERCHRYPARRGRRELCSRMVSTLCNRCRGRFDLRMPGSTSRGLE